MPLRVVPSPTGLPSKRCPCNGFFDLRLSVCGMFSHQQKGAFFFGSPEF